MSLQLNSDTIAEISIVELRGEPTVGGHRLTINLKVAFLPRPSARIVHLLSLEGQLRVSGAGQEQVIVGDVRPAEGNIPVATYEYASSRNLMLSVDLGRPQLEAIENIRNGGDLDFTLRLAGTVHFGGAFNYTGDQLNYKAIQGAWVPLLARLGYEKRLLLEVPIPDDVSQPNLAAAVEHLKNAQKQLMLGYARESVGCCRDAIETLALVLGDTGQQLPHDRLRSKKERLMQYRRSLIQLAHPSRHADPGSAQFDWGRGDGIAMIAKTSSLIAWIDRLSKDGQL